MSGFKRARQNKNYKYLERPPEVIKDDIPEDYRNDPKVLSALAAHNPEDIKKVQQKNPSSSYTRN